METVLLIEDETLTRWMASRTLRKAGYEVREAGNLEEALQQAVQCPIGKTLFIIDEVLPGALGTEVAALLQRIHEKAPVLFLSGYTMDILDPHEVEKEGTSVLARLFTPQVLIRRVRQMFDGSLPHAHPSKA